MNVFRFPFGELKCLCPCVPVMYMVRFFKPPSHICIEGQSLCLERTISIDVCHCTAVNKAKALKDYLVKSN